MKNRQTAISAFFSSFLFWNREFREKITIRRFNTVGEILEGIFIFSSPFKK